ncbi:MAG: hypothetical protein GWN94_02580, partial [Phycisphaerae bacterium]|nr:hypothetical protein [Phycisphaerae bacterium]NIS49994.1 hypothetical protein [Phycisphaerae bacterium]NIX29585.1 hypothetical protein [Phycisphaerae bacterium]
MRTLRNTGMPSGRKVAATGSKLELQLKMQLDALGENYVREHKFAREVLDTNEKIREGLAKRGLKDWRFDFAYKTERVAVEVEGGVYTQGRHTRGEGFEEDCEKYNQATLLGWRVL